jgi:hypothetical protein
MQNSQPDLAAAIESRVVAALVAERISDQEAELLLEVSQRLGRNEFVVQCAWCERFELDGSWYPAPGEFFRSAIVVARSTHGICPDCQRGVQARS